MADGNGGGSGFLGVIVGALLIAVLVVGYFVYAGHGPQQEALNVHVTAPSAPSSGSP